MDLLFIIFDDEAEDVILIGLCNNEAVLAGRSFGEVEEEGNFKISFIFGNLLVKDEELQESGVIGALFVFKKDDNGVVF